MTDINTSNVISLWIFWFTVYSSPSKTIRTYKKVIKKTDICYSNQYYANPDINSIFTKNGFLVFVSSSTSAFC